MAIIYNSPNYHVFEYAENLGFELIKKSHKKATFVNGLLADDLRDYMTKAAAKDDPVDEVDEFLTRYDDLFNLPLILH